MIQSLYLVMYDINKGTVTISVQFFLILKSNSQYTYLDEEQRFISYLGIPIHDPEQSELTEHGESGTTWEDCEQGKGPTSSSETEFPPGWSSDPLLGSYSGIYLKTILITRH